MHSNTRSSLHGDDGGAGDATCALAFERSLTIAQHYPTNIVYSRNYEYQLEEYARQLDNDRSKLFGNQNVVDFLEFREETGGTGKFNNSLLQFLGKSSHSLQEEPLSA